MCNPNFFPKSVNTSKVFQNVQNSHEKQISNYFGKHEIFTVNYSVAVKDYRTPNKICWIKGIIKKNWDLEHIFY